MVSSESGRCRRDGRENSLSKVDDEAQNMTPEVDCVRKVDVVSKVCGKDGGVWASSFWREPLRGGGTRRLGRKVGINNAQLWAD